MQHHRSELQYYRPKELSLKELIQQNEFYSFFIHSCAYISIFLCLIASIKSNSINITLFISTSILILFFTAISFYFTPEKRDDKEIIIANDPKRDYLISLGTEVKKFSVMQ